MGIPTRSPGRFTSGVWRLFLCSAVIGVGTGLAAVTFYWMLSRATTLFMEELAGYRPAGSGSGAPEDPFRGNGPDRPWVLAVLPAMGGLVCGWLVFRFAPEAEGHGTDAAIKTYHHHGGSVRARVPLIKAVASAVTIGTGGSGGAEGPICQVGSGFGYIMSRWLGMSPYHRRMLMAAGMAGGIGAMFRAPVAGALFAAEVLYRDMDLEFEVLVPGVISSVIGYAVFALIRGTEPLFEAPDFVFNNPLQLLPYLFMALIVAGGASFYIRAFYGVRNLFRKIRFVPRMFHPFLGGVAVGAMGLFFPQALGQGYGMVQRALVQGTELEALFGTATVGFLLLLFVMKVLTTAFSIGSGGSGGVFGPALVAGSALGGACGLLARQIFPRMSIQPGAFSLVGMAGFFAAAANTPISTVIIVSEITGNYHLLVPSLWVCTIAYLLARKLSIYENQMPNRLSAPVHQGTMASAVMRNVTVADAIAALHPDKVTVVSGSTTYNTLLGLHSSGRQASYPVADESGRVSGMVWEEDLLSLVSHGETVGSAVTADDLSDGLVVAFPEEDLMTVIRRMSEESVAEVLVQDEAGSILALLSMRDIMGMYSRKLTTLQSGEEEGYLPGGYH